jgi:hypothetical protein
MANHDPDAANVAPGCADSEESVARLLQLAGERTAPRHLPMERARAAAHETWRRMLAREAQQRGMRRAFGWTAGLATAASVVLALVLFRVPDAVAPTIATVERVEGLAQLEPAGGSPVIVRARTSMPAGARLFTQQGRVALSLGSLSIRVDWGTTLELRDGELKLQHGTVYVDSGGAPSPSSLRIVTPAGAVEHVGTQYQVQVQGDRTVVRVREGRVHVDRGQPARAGFIDAAEELVMVRGAPDARRSVSLYGPEWRWCAEIAPPFDIEGRPLAELLAWLTRENGWQLDYATETARSAAAEIRLHGAAATAASPDTLTRVAAITGFSLSAQDGRLRVSDAR